MATATATKPSTLTAILSRVFDPERPEYTPEVARYVLALNFALDDHRRVDELSFKAQEGTLSDAERVEIEQYLEIGATLGVLHSKARVALRKAGLKP